MKKTITRLIKVCIAVILLMTFLPKTIIHASESFQVVKYDNDGNIIARLETYDSFKAANEKRRAYGRSENYGVIQGDELLAVNYGVIDFQGKTKNIDLQNLDIASSTYINGAYGIDALYLGTNTNLDKVLLRISGANFSTNFMTQEGKLLIRPYSTNLDLSHYFVEGDTLYHYISSKNTVTKSGYRLPIGYAPNYLKQNVKYYSYDGNYFYSDYKLMVNDFVAETNTNAVNAQNPHYLYYLYLPYRTKTHYGTQNFADWFYTRNQYNQPVRGLISKFNTTEAAFVESQNLYGANGLLTYAIGRNESGDGYSKIAQDKLNLFGHRAFDSSAYSSADSYSENSASIYDHAKEWMSKGYLNINSFRFNGGYLGNKASGINLLYASDPYWGEKAAANYYAFDKYFGKKDYNQVTIGIANDYSKLNFYTNPNYDNLIYSLTTKSNYSYAILDAVTINSKKWYKVQSDVSLTHDRRNYIRLGEYDGTYSFDNNYAYVEASSFKTILNESAIQMQNGYDNTNTYYVNGTKANGWQKVSGKNYFFKNGKKYTGYINESNQNRYFVEGEYANWWHDDGTAWYFFQNGIKYNGYGVDSSGKHYFDNGKYANWWYDDGTAWYFFQNGIKHNGYGVDNSGKHYFDNGKYANWWYDDGTAWYFFQNGIKHNGYGVDNSGKHYFDNGKYANWWYDDGTAWYFFQNGIKHNGYGVDSSGKHYFDNGKYANWWYDDGTAWYFFQNGIKHNGYAKDNSGTHYFKNGKYAD